MSGFHRIDALPGRFYNHFVGMSGLSLGPCPVTISLDLFLRLLRSGHLPGMKEIIEYVLFAGVFLSAHWVLRPLLSRSESCFPALKELVQPTMHFVH